MSAYIVLDVSVLDPAPYEEYKKLCGPTIEQYGGRFLARGGYVENLEGEWRPSRVVIIEFDSVERAKSWWASEEYRLPKEMRQRASNSRVIVVGGA